MYENRIFKRDAFIKVTCRRFRDKRSDTRATALAHHKEPSANSNDLINSYNRKSKEFKLSFPTEVKLDKDNNVIGIINYINVTDSKGNSKRMDYDKNKKPNN